MAPEAPAAPEKLTVAGDIILTFDSGSEEPSTNRILQGQTSKSEGKVVEVMLGGGTWGGGDAWGTIELTEVMGTFEDNELVDIEGGTANVLTVDGQPAVITTSGTELSLKWNNRDYYYYILIERKKTGFAYAQIDQISGDRESYDDDGLVNDTEYWYRIRGRVFKPRETSDYSNEAVATTLAALEDPTDVVATPISHRAIEIVFTDNSALEDYHRVEREISTDPGTWVKIVDLQPNRDFFRDEGHSLFLTEAGYTPCIDSDIGKQVQDDTVEIGVLLAYDNIRRRWTIDSTVTIADTSAITITAGTGVGIADGASTGLVKGSTYTYRVRAEDSVGQSNWATSTAVTTISEPAAPVLDVILAADITDQSIRIRWSNVANETGYRIEQEKTAELPFEADEADLIAVVGAGVTDFLATGLDPNTSYSFRVRAYNAAGNSAFSATRAATTDAVYELTEFEKWARNPKIEPIYLIEVYPKMTLTGFTLESGVTWKVTIGADDRGIDILEVFENGDAYVEKTSIVTVEATASTFWFDYDNRILYIHTSDDTDPANFLIEGAFWLYFTNGKDKEFTVNGRLNHYLNLLAKEDIPDTTQEIKPYFEGSFSISSGSVSLKNAKIGGMYYFDRLYKRYTWRNRKLNIKVGGDTFTYMQFEDIFTGLISSVGINDKRILFSLRDSIGRIERSLPVNKYWLSTYPRLEEGKEGTLIPKSFGFIGNIEAVCIDTENKKYKFHDGRVKTVTEAKRSTSGGDVVLTEDVDFYIDYQRGEITIDRDGVTVDDEDDIILSFWGTVDSADAVIDNGAEVFKYIMNTFANLPNALLDLDSIYEAKYANTVQLAVHLYKEKGLEDIIRTLEHSIKAYSRQDESGKIGLKTAQITALLGARHILDFQIFDFSQEKGVDSLYKDVGVFYNEDSRAETWTVKTEFDADLFNKYNVEEPLDIITYLKNSADAESLITAILALLDKDFIEFEVPVVLYGRLAGDLIKFSRTRFYDADGTASNITLRILRISKMPASGKTGITAEVV